MNERIRELAEQAGMTDDKFGMYFAKDKHDEDGVDLEKFAELIVRECCDIINQEGLHTDYISAEMNQYVFKRLMKAFDKIEKHFGVEE